MDRVDCRMEKKKSSIAAVTDLLHSVIVSRKAPKTTYHLVDLVSSWPDRDSHARDSVVKAFVGGSEPSEEHSETPAESSSGEAFGG